MSHRVDRDEVRGAVYLADVDALVDALTWPDWPGDALQLMGDAVLVVARGRRPVIEPAARRAILELQDRGWEGDAELAAQIESVFGWGPAPML